MKALLFACALLWPGFGFATMVPPRSLTNLVADADHVIIAKVTLVDMIDGNGLQITNLDARTGPFLSNTIRLHITVETNGVLSTTAKQVPRNVTISLWPAWHYSLGQIKEIEETQKRIFLLKGPDFKFVYVTEFVRALSERTEIERLLRDKIRRTNRLHRMPR